MRKLRIPKVILLAAIFVTIIALAYYQHQNWESVELHRYRIEEKVKSIKEGMDEKSVIDILGKPDSVALVSADDPENMFVGKYKGLFRYRYTIFLGKLPFTTEGGRWAEISIYFDENSKTVIYVKWLIV